MSKLRIDLSHGLIEVEGAESFVLSVYNDFKGRFTEVGGKFDPQSIATAVDHPAAAAPKPKAKKARAKAAGNGATAKPKGRSRENGTLLKDLDLTNSKQGRLKDFHAQFDAKSAPDHNLVFAYYLQHKLGLTGITPDHFYTCYREVSVRVPGALRQSLFNTANRNGWLNTADMENIVVTTRGMNHLEHDLPKKAKQ